MYCVGCGSAMGEGAAFCSACGKAVGGPQAASMVIAATHVVPAGPEGATWAGSGTASAASLPVTRVAYAGFWLRFVALLIDSFALWFIFVPALAITGLGAGLLGALSSAGESGDPSEIIAAMFSGGLLALLCLFFLVRWAYYSLMESSSWQATLGKKALGLYVTDMSGERVTFGRAAGRNLGKFITEIIPLAIGYIMAGFTEKKQALHDMIASCLVLRKL